MDFTAIRDTKDRVHELQKEARRYRREAFYLDVNLTIGSPLDVERKQFARKSKLRSAERLEEEAQGLIAKMAKAPW